METNNRPNAKAIASLVVSCVSVLNCCLWQLAILCAVVGIVLGIIALREENQRQKDLAVAGIVVGAVGLTLSITLVVISIMLYSEGGGVNPGTVPAGNDTVMAALPIWGQKIFCP
ncbi:MAG: DUF4190 domain-containing protein [Eubacterium sp.]|nr:DUF4190 domain-containing protein [Eubacterium sp.]